jgi:transcriptional regulator with XRE-family HTH domain
MNMDPDSVNRRMVATAGAFGSLIRRRRKALRMSQSELALVTGVGRRFLVDLEAGKATCQLGRSLLVAEALGLSLLADAAPGPAAGPLPVALDLSDLPDLADLPED